jgi:hypothetical protein
VLKPVRSVAVDGKVGEHNHREELLQYSRETQIVKRVATISKLVFTMSMTLLF